MRAGRTLVVVWSDTYAREVWEVGRGPAISAWVALPITAALIALELLLGLAIAETYLAGHWWLGAILAITLGLAGPIGAVSGWRSKKRIDAGRYPRLRNAERRAGLIGTIPTLLLLIWVVPMSAF